MGSARTGRSAGRDLRGRLMDTAQLVATWGERQTFAVLVAAASVAVCASLFRFRPNEPDMARAHALPYWRKAGLSLPAALYVGFATWRQPPVPRGENIFADLYGEFAIYDPILFVAILVVSIVAGTDLTGERATRIAVSALGQVVLLFLAMVPVVLGLQAIYQIMVLS